MGLAMSKSKKFGFSFLAFMCGVTAITGLCAFFSDLVSSPRTAANDLIVFVLFGTITLFALLKLFGRKVRLIPESRKYSPGSKLPVVSNSGLTVYPGEICHIAERVQIGVLTTVKGTVRKSSGTRVRGLSGISYSGSSRSQTVNKDVLDKNPGTLYVTNRRIVVASSKYGFAEPLESVTAVTPYANSFDVQLKRGNYTIFVRDPLYISSVLQSAISLKVRGTSR